jgi:uncharacterized protein YndB with AHSA1/START domain
MTTLTEQGIENLTLRVEQEIRVRASIEKTFAALLEQLGPGNEMMDGAKMPMKLEPWPGGRWFRNLGDDTGHFWATVQSIKRPTLLEFCGPLFMSQPVSNNVIYRLSEDGGETVIKFLHTAFGPILETHREGVNKGWSYMNDKARQRAEKA